MEWSWTKFTFFLVAGLFLVAIVLYSIIKISAISEGEKELAYLSFPRVVREILKPDLEERDVNIIALSSVEKITSFKVDEGQIQADFAKMRHSGLYYADPTGEKQPIYSKNLIVELTNDKSINDYRLRESGEILVAFSLGTEGGLIRLKIFLPERLVTQENEEINKWRIYWAMLWSLELLEKNYDESNVVFDDIFNERLSKDQNPVSFRLD